MPSPLTLGCSSNSLHLVSTLQVIRLICTFGRVSDLLLNKTKPEVPDKRRLSKALQIPVAADASVKLVYITPVSRHSTLTAGLPGGFTNLAASLLSLCSGRDHTAFIRALIFNLTFGSERCFIKVCLILSTLSALVDTSSYRVSNPPLCRLYPNSCSLVLYLEIISFSIRAASLLVRLLLNI